MSNNNDNRTKNEKQKEFDTYIFRLLELIENMNTITDGQYKESCDIFMELRKLFQETKYKIINTPIYQTMTRRAIRNIGNQKYLTEIEKIYDDKYQRCNRCSSFILKDIKNVNMINHKKTKKCCMFHEAKFQSIKLGEIKDERIANRMIYASTFTFNLKKVKTLGDLDKKQRIIIFPSYESYCEEYGLKETNSKTIKEIYENQLPNQNIIDWYKDENGKWCENTKIDIRKFFGGGGGGGGYKIKLKS